MPHVILGVILLAAVAAGFFAARGLTETAKIDEDTKRRLAPFTGVCFAHKGLYQKDQSVPENSMPAFRAALEHGYGIDCDVQRTYDGQALCFCDSHMRVACGIDERMVSFSYDNLRKLKLFGTNEHMPLLSEVLEMVDGRAPMIIEVKSPAGPQGIPSTCETIYAVLKDYTGPYCVASFDPHVLKWFRINAPEVLRMQASMPYFDWRENDRNILRCFYMSRLFCNRLSRPHMIAFSMGSKNRMLKLALRGGAPLVLYTANKKHRHKELMQICDSLIFEDYLPPETRDYVSEDGVI